MGGAGDRHRPLNSRAQSGTSPRLRSYGASVANPTGTVPRQMPPTRRIHTVTVARTVGTVRASPPARHERVVRPG